MFTDGSLKTVGDEAKGSISGYEILISEINPSPHVTLTATGSMYSHPDCHSNGLVLPF